MAACSNMRGAGPVKCEPAIEINNIRRFCPKMLCLPVSGHGLVEQIGIILWLTLRGYRPEFCAGASGGAIAAALGIRHQWNSLQWQKWVANCPSVKIFKERTLGIIEGLLGRESLYEIGDGLEYIFKFIGSPEGENNFRNQELLVSALNISQGQLEIFSTVKESNSVLRDQTGPLQLFGVSCRITYLGELTSNEYRKRLIQVLKASSAVPMVYPAFEIDGNFYQDGGVSFASPLAPLLSLRKVKDVLYILPEDIELPPRRKTKDTKQTPLSMLENGQAFLAHTSRASYIKDRANYLSSLCCGELKQLSLRTGDSSTFEEALRETNGSKRMVELFPCNSRSLPILSNHDKQDMMKRIGEQLQSFRYRIFYT
jgi:predicted acylesterase/phospholipase RssA